jgi:hypothetical protein
VHLLVTDRLICPRCGPGFGLILLARKTGGERRILDGELGCPNCRDSFPIQKGFGDLRAPPRGELPEAGVGPPGNGDPEEAERLQALLGIVRGPGTLALVGEPARHAHHLVDLVEGVELLVVDAGTASWPEEDRITRLVSRPGLPVFGLTLRGVVVDGRLGTSWVAEAARVTAPRNRVVVVHADEGAAGALEEAGLDVLAQEAGTVVAARA